MGRPRQTMTSNKNNILTRHLSSICGLSTASSKKEITSLDLIFPSSKKSSKGSCYFHHANSFHKKINGLNNVNNVESLLQEHDKKKSYSNEGKLNNKNRIALGEISDFHNRIKDLKLSNEKDKEKKQSKSNIPFYRRLYSNDFMEFENDRTNSIQYVKKYKEDDITFTKSKILPEIQWQDLDNDVDTSDEQKKSAIRKEVNWLGEAIKQIQNNEKFFKHNVTMYKLSQKYPNNS